MKIRQSKKAHQEFVATYSSLASSSTARNVLEALAARVSTHVGLDASSISTMYLQASDRAIVREGERAVVSFCQLAFEWMKEKS